MRFRRKRPDEAMPGDGPEVDEPADEATDLVEAPSGEGEGPRTQGPWDVTEVDLDPDDPARVDLGGLIVSGRPGLELRLQVDGPTQSVAAVLLVGQEGALELRPFAAPRNSDIWEETRRHIAAETARHGGTATEVDGPFGKELRLMMNVTSPEGHATTQPSRVLGISGPRWLLRATLIGGPATQDDPTSDLEQALRDVVVVRGSEAMAPGDAIPLTMPPHAEPLEAPPG